jgi:PAS domain S-box-containing protein
MKLDKTCYESLIRNSADMIIALDKEGAIQYASPSVERILGYKPHEVIGNKFLDWVHPNDLREAQEAFASRSKMPGIAPAPVQARGRHKNGSWRALEALGTNLLDDPNVQALILNVRDVTERLQAERALRENEQLLDSVLAYSPDTIYTLDVGSGKAAFFNREGFCGYSLSELKAPDSIMHAVHPKDVDAVRENWKKILAKSEIVPIEYRLRNKTGNLEWVRQRITILSRNADDSPKQLMVTLSIITEQVRSQRQLALQHAVTLAFSGADTLAEAMPAVLKAVCDGLDWKRGECWSAHWSVDRQIMRLRCIETCQLSLNGLANFENTTRGIEFAPGEGLPGRVWQSGKPEWTPDISKDHFARAALAKKAGIRAAFAFPIKVGDEVLGVMTFLDGKIRPPDTDQLRVMESIGHQIGQFVERKRAEKALQDSEERYRMLFNLLPYGGEILDINGNIVDCSPSTAKILGYDRDEIIGRRIRDFMDSDSLRTFQEKFPLILKGETQEAEINMVRKDGSLLNILRAATPIFNAEGRVSGALALSVDITARKQAEERFLRAFNASPAGLLISAREDERMIDVNPSLLKTVGYEREEVIGLSPRDINLWVNTTDHERIAGAIQLDGRASNLEVQIRAKSGDIRNVLISIEPISLGDKRCLLSVIHDVTEVRRAEQEARLLQTIALGVSNAKDLNETIQNILRLVCEATGWVVGEAWIPNADGSLLELHLARYSRDPDMVEFHRDSASFTFARGVGLPGRAWESRKAVWIEDVTQDANFPRAELARRAGLKAAVSIPVLAGGRVTLVLDFFLKEARPQDPRLVELISAIAAELGGVIERKRAEEAERDQRILAEALRETAETLSGSLDYGQVLDQILDIAGRVVPHDSSTILLLEGDGLRLARARGYDETPFESDFSQLNLHDPGNLRQMFETRQPVLVPDVFAYSHWKTLPGTEWLRSSVGAPMISQGDVIGFVLLDSRTPNFFTPLHAERLQAFANQAALAIHNARLYQQAQDEISKRKLAEESLRRRLAELESISKISAALRNAQTLEEMLPTLLDETLSALETDAGDIWLYRAEENILGTVVARGWFSALAEASTPPDEGSIGGRVFTRGQTLVSREFSSDPRARQSVVSNVPPGWGGICVPLRSAGQVVGVMFVSVQLPRQITTEEQKLLESLAQIAGAALHRLGLHEETRRRLEQLQSLHAIDRAITSNHNLEEILDILLEQTRARLGVDAADVLLLDPENQTLEFKTAQGFRAKGIERSRLRVGEGHAGIAALEKRVILISNLSEDGKFCRAGLLEDENLVSYCATPLIAKGEVKGVLEIFNKTPLEFDADWLNFLEMLASQAAIAVDNAELFSNLERTNSDLIMAYDATIEGWSRAMDLRDEETEGHTRRVTNLTVKLARATGINEADIIHIRRGALLHDIGKMGIPDSILLKPAKLTDEEWEIMRKHPQYAYEMLSPIAYLRPALDIPYCHHEKWDGTGYPRGLKGVEIPLAARLFAVVDVWDAVTSNRPYRPAWTEEQALEYVRGQSGSHFDPQAVELFLRMICKGGAIQQGKNL